MSNSKTPPNSFRDNVSFFIFGLLNNFFYCVFLSAAGDILKGTGIPHGAVLMADIIPCFSIKLVAPYVMYRFSYPAQVLTCVFLSSLSMVTVATTEALPLRLLGIVFASLSSGLGESVFLALSTLYHPHTLAGYASGTGGAGLAGSMVYLVATTVLGLAPKKCLLVFSVLPIFMVIAFFILLNPHYKTPLHLRHEKTEIVVIDSEKKDYDIKPPHEITFQDRISYAKELLIPYMMPLFIVYLAEYIINQGVSPTILFPVEKPFHSLRDYYVTYQALYQIGVFISRTAVRWIQFDNIWYPSIIQVGMLGLMMSISIYNYVPSVWIVFGIIIVEGLLGGTAYASGFHNISKNVREDKREFSMAAASVADSAGISLASFVSICIQPWLCNIQLRQGRDLCANH